MALGTPRADPGVARGAGGRHWDLADEIAGEAWHVIAFAVPELRDPPLLDVPRDALVTHPRLGLVAAAASLRAGDRSGAAQRFEAAAASERTGAARLEVEAALAGFDGDEERRRTLALALVDAPVEDGFERGREAAGAAGGRALAPRRGRGGSR